MKQKRSLRFSHQTRLHLQKQWFYLPLQTSFKLDINKTETHQTHRVRLSSKWLRVIPPVSFVHSCLFICWAVDVGFHCDQFCFFRSIRPVTWLAESKLINHQTPSDLHPNSALLFVLLNIHEPEQQVHLEAATQSDHSRVCRRVCVIKMCLPLCLCADKAVWALESGQDHVFDAGHSWISDF